jgi:hypothetical protein
MRDELRDRVFGLTAGRCEWPSCDRKAVELAHLTSKGMGGSKFRDIVGNVMAACYDHARVSDGLPPVCGGLAARNREYARVPGAVAGPDGWRTRDVTEALRVWLADQDHRQITY